MQFIFAGTSSEKSRSWVRSLPDGISWPNLKPGTHDQVLLDNFSLTWSLPHKLVTPAFENSDLSRKTCHFVSYWMFHNLTCIAKVNQISWLELDLNSHLRVTGPLLRQLRYQVTGEQYALFIHFKCTRDSRDNLILVNQKTRVEIPFKSTFLVDFSSVG